MDIETELRQLLWNFRYDSSNGGQKRGLQRHHIDALTEVLLPFIDEHVSVPHGDPHSLRLFCIVCREPIPLERAVRGSNTHAEECRKHRDAMKRAQVDKKKCRHCMKPSTAEERKLFQKWRREQPDYVPAKRGAPRGPRSKKEPEQVTAEVPA